MRGRKPKPSHLKLVQGNPGKRKVNRREPRPRREIPSAPDHLSDRARVAWGAIATKLDRIGVLTEVDDLALERVAELVADVIELKLDIRKRGRTSKIMRSGRVIERARPQVKMLESADARLRAWMTEFGLTPSSRSRLTVSGQQDADDPADAYF